MQRNWNWIINIKLKLKKNNANYATRISSHDSGSVLSNVIYQVEAGPCDPDPPTLQTDGRTDRRTDDMQSQYRALRYSAASRGNNNNNNNNNRLLFQLFLFVNFLFGSVL